MKREAVRAAIDALPLKDGADTQFAEMHIMQLLEMAPHFGVDRQPTKKQAAERLDALVRALREMRAAAASVGGPAFEALNAAKHRRGLSWLPTDAHWSFLYPGQFGDQFDKCWPEFEACAIEAAKNLRGLPDAPPGRPRNSSMEEFAFSLASLFHLLTNRRPAAGKGEGLFASFVGAIFTAGQIDASASYCADRGARRWRAEKSR